MRLTTTSTIAAAVLTLSAPASLAAQHTGGGAMIDVTCEEFLDLPASDQEMYGTALTTARMDEAGGSEAEETPVSGNEDDEETSSDSDGISSSGMSINVLSPTVVALVTICENTLGSGSDAGAESEGDAAN